MKLSSLSFRVLVFLALLATSLSALHAAPYLRNGDRVVIYGDSITQQRLYSHFIQQYFYCRYPNLKLHFYNAGWDGDWAGGGVNRLERDVLTLHPTVVTLFFGMNDGLYRPLDQATATKYHDNMEKLITTLQAKKIRVVVFAPGCIDADLQKPLGEVHYNSSLEALGKIALDLAAKYHCPSADVFHPMLELLTAQKANDPNFRLHLDGVHPSYAGHLVMTQEMLKALGAEPMPVLGTIDLNNHESHGLVLVNQAPYSVVLRTAAIPPVPFWFEPSANQVMTASGFLNVVGQRLTVKGLTASAYHVLVNDTNMGIYTKEQLANGIMISGAYSLRGKVLHDIITRKEENYLNAWRNVRLPLLGEPTMAKAVKAMLATDEDYQHAIVALANPVDKVTVSLIAKPEGENLALGKPFETDAPNVYGAWGTKTLTDGSWEENEAHCWASNDSAAFPKHVTIDLQTPQTISAVVVGVPNFGSTRTINVSVSTDGKTYTEVGSHQFKQQMDDQYTYRFTDTQARYVRLTYTDHYEQEVGYSRNFVFTSEVEVYR